ncbi:MAG TPA: 3-hydroxyacyl-CoA dehydrogenase NAD-binding domain-containing protein [Gammaproteobacteria bacterium]|nr:3-hydroxyacyl-CoA dehydrogenase NAD-binding domain-containing protein [Gammaproteobacteria bacterium]
MNTMAETDFKHWQLTRDEKGIAWLGLDQAGTSTNTLGSEVMQELGRVLDTIEQDMPQALIVFSRKEKGFVAGADIKEFTALETPDQAYELIRGGQQVLERLAALPCPTVAMIHGFALGGGLELALACRYRVASEAGSTQLGLPEVKLGIHPGFGGTVRSVAVMGVLPAMQLMLTGKSMRARPALSSGLVDRLASPEELRERACNLALSAPAPHRAPLLQRLLSLSPLRPLVAIMLRRQLQAKAREEHYPAPYAIVRLWQRHGGILRPRSFELEARSIAELMCGDTARNLVRVFFLQDRLKGLGRKARFKPRRLHVIGAGTMGGDIAAWCASRGMEVSVQDQEAKYVEKAFSRAHKFFEKKLKAKEKVEDAVAHLHMDIDGKSLPDAELVIEAIIEDREAKQSLLKSIEPKLAEQALLATNTSSIPLETLATSLQSPSRLVGLHFFNPVTRMPLVEVVSSEHTGEETRERALAAVRAMGKLPVPVSSGPGFLVNRILAPYMMSALTAWNDGIALEAIDRAAEDFGMPMGPAELADTVGLDIALAVAEELKDVIKVTPPEKTRQMVDQGHVGRKSGQGLYTWEDGKAQKQQSRAGAADQALQDRLILPMLNEAVRCLREGVVAEADLIDAGVIFGTGFAPFRGGPLHYARQAGPSVLKERLNKLAEKHGELYKPDAGWDTL